MKGNVRTNCIDCLDRTNVVQTQIAKFALKYQFSILGIIPYSEDLTSTSNEYFIKINNMLNLAWYSSL